MLGQKRLVGRDDMLARRRAPSTYWSAGSVPPMVSMMTSTSGSSISWDDVGREPDAIESNIARLVRVANRNPAQADRPAGPTGDPFGMLGQQPRDSSAHRPQSDQADRHVFHVAKLIKGSSQR